ncbi:FAD-dependent oxidoreductase [Candidatus Poribacteria bacterium]|nr:FAD-dependent oxidoreductase [Candidatus Poribacteria bacterium]
MLFFQNPEYFEVVVVGGGVAGLSVTRELARRSIPVLLLEKGNMLAPEQSTKHHNWLHAGTRHARHPDIAHLLIRAFAKVLKDAEGLIEDKPAYYVTTEDGTAEGYTDAWDALGIQYCELSPIELKRREPALYHAPIKRVFQVPDKIFSPHRLLMRIRDDALRTGYASIRTNAAVTQLVLSKPNNRVCGVRYWDGVEKRERFVESTLTINTTGAWAGKLLMTAGIYLSDRFKLFKAHLVVAAPRLTQGMIVCLDDPFQVIVPHTQPAVSVLDAASDKLTTFSNDLEVEPAIEQYILDAISRLIPELNLSWEEPYCCIKAEYVGKASTTNQGKHPGISLIDHRSEHGVDGLISGWPGKFSAHPIFAEGVIKHVEAHL